MIVQFVGSFTNGEISDWSSDPQLTWVERANGTYTRLTYSIRLATATSELSPRNKYSSFSYVMTETENENITVDIALTPRQGNVSMSMNTL